MLLQVAREDIGQLTDFRQRGRAARAAIYTPAVHPAVTVADGFARLAAK
jgi:hypothetical protein